MLFLIFGALYLRIYAICNLPRGAQQNNEIRLKAHLPDFFLSEFSIERRQEKIITTQNTCNRSLQYQSKSPNDNN